MNKGELVDAIAAKASISKKETDSILNAFVDTVMEAVSSGDKVTLVHCGVSLAMLNDVLLRSQSGCQNLPPNRSN